MVSFIKPNLLGSLSEYINRFVNPIQNGQHRNSKQRDVYLMKQRACVLYELLTGFVSRKDYSLLKEYLPPKFEYIINIRLSDLQSNLYYLYLQEKVAMKQRLPVLKKDFKSARLFADYQYLQKIWTHPFLLYPYFIDRWKKGLEENDDSRSKTTSSDDDDELETLFIDDEENTEESKKKSNGKENKNILNKMNEFKRIMSNTRKRKSSNLSITTSDFDDSTSTNSDDDIEIDKIHSRQNRTIHRTSISMTIDSTTSDIENSNKPWLNKMRQQFWFPFLDMIHEQSEFDVELGGKILLFKFIIDKCAEIGDKILLFSRSLYSLDYIEKFLKYLHIENEKQYQILLSNNTNNEHIPPPVQWLLDQDYFRIDGRTKIILRKQYTERFNNPSNTRHRLILISTQAGGIGINLTASNRIIVFDASWNPSHDAQALFGAYRFGQTKPVYIYRFIAHGTMEEKIYHRQVVKQSVSKRVIDDYQLDRHFTQRDIKELYSFTLEQLPETQSTSNRNSKYAEPEDRLLLDLLDEHSRWIHSYHCHDSLLENKIDESLTTEERRQALEEYENLKHLPIQRFPSQQANNTVIINIPAKARWEQNGVTVVGDHREYNALDQLYWPVDLFVHDDETVIFTDWANERIVQWKMNNENGQIIAGGNGTGNQLDQLNGPTDILIDKSTDSLIICDRGNRRVVRWYRSRNENQVEILVTNIACRGFARDDMGYLYIADYQKHVVKRYQIGDQNGVVVAGGNGKGIGLNQLNELRYLFVDRQQAVYVSDSSNHRVMKWNKGAKEGIVVAGGRGKGHALAQLSFPYGLFVDALGTIYVADSSNNRVMRWRKGGKHGTIVVGGNGKGLEANQLNCPRGLSFDRHGNLYVVDYWNHRIQQHVLLNVALSNK